MIGTPRRTCRGRPIVCPGPCNHRRQKRIEKKLAEKSHWHACSWFNVNDNDENDDEGEEEEEIDVGKAALLDETATMTSNVALIDVALSQIGVCQEKGEEETSPRPVPIRCDFPECSGVPEMITVALCSEQDRKQNLTPVQSQIAKSSAKYCTSKRRNWRKIYKNPFVVYLLVFCLYALIHMILAALAMRVSLYEAFFSSQVCGIAAFLFWKTTGTIPL